jgi:hypothetical protein
MLYLTLTTQENKSARFYMYLHRRRTRRYRLQNRFWLESSRASYVFKMPAQRTRCASPRRPEPLDPRATSRLSNRPDSPLRGGFGGERATSSDIGASTTSRSGLDAVFYPGGHGPLWDLARDKNSIGPDRVLPRGSKPVALVCHAPGVPACETRRKPLVRRQESPRASPTRRKRSGP